MKLNTDGSRNSQNGKTASGGIICNSSGHQICGFQANLGIGEVLNAETWGLFHGLKLAVDHNINNLIVESDSATLVNSLLNGNTDMHPLGALLSCCKNLMQKFQTICICHIYRECNSVADALAKNAINSEYEILILENPPCHATQAYFDDLEDTVRTRIVPCGQFG